MFRKRYRSKKKRKINCSQFLCFYCVSFQLFSLHLVFFDLVRSILYKRYDSQPPFQFRAGYHKMTSPLVTFLSCQLTGRRCFSEILTVPHSCFLPKMPLGKPRTHMAHQWTVSRDEQDREGCEVPLPQCQGFASRCRSPSATVPSSAVGLDAQAQSNLREGERRTRKSVLLVMQPT